MQELDIKALEDKVDALLEMVRRLADENEALRAQQDHLMLERAALIEKSEQARSRVESMIVRLKSMEL